MTNLSLNIDSTSLVLVSASFADQSNSSNYALSASWAPSIMVPISLSWASSSISSSYANTASLLLGSVTNAISASYATNGSTVTWYSASILGGGTVFTMSLSQPIGDARAYFQCVSPDGGYAIGDIVPIEAINTAGLFFMIQTLEGNGVGPYCWTLNFSFNSSSITLYTYGVYTTAFQMPPKTGNNSSYPYFEPNISHWQLLFRVTLQ